MEKIISNSGNFPRGTNRVLIVDDQPDNLRLLSDILTGQGCKVQPAPNGRVALEAVKHRLPDLILLDIRMPEMDGFEVCRRLKADERTHDVPIIFISALKETGDKVKAFQAGAVDYITKPLREGEVLARVETHLRLRRLQKEQEHYSRTLEHRVRKRTKELEDANRKLREEIAERKQAEEELIQSEKKYYSLFNEARDGIVLIDTKTGRIVECNPEFMRLTGRTPEQLKEMKVWDLRPPHKIEAAKKKFFEIKEKGEGKSREFEFLKPNGEIVPIEFVSKVLNIGGKKYLQSIARDITERRNAEEELEKHHEHLEELVKERTTELRKEIEERKQAEGALSESEKLLRATLESTADGILVVDDKGRVTHSNTPFANMWHIPGELVDTRENQKLINYVLDQLEAPDVFLTKVQELYESDRESFDTLLFKDGRVFERYSSPLIREGKVAGRVWSFRDITKRKELEHELSKSREQLDLALRSANLGLWDFNPQTGEQHINDTWAEMLGHKKEEITNNVEEWAKRIHPDDYQSTWSRYLEHAQGKVPIYRAEHRLRTRSGKYKWIFSTGRVVERDEQGSPVRAVGIHMDIDERKEMERRLALAKEAAEEASKAKSEFLALMSHEIRTPMNAITGMTYLLQQTDMTRKQNEYVNKIQMASNNLIGIIDDILDFSKIEAGKMEIESTPFELDDVLQNVSDITAIKAEEKGLEFIISTDCNVPRHLIGDPLRLNQILTNLTDNAIKFTESGEIIISTHLEKKFNKKAKLLFSIRDTGIGMTEEQKSKLFKAFRQVDTSITRKFGGTGLGLTICKRIVEMMRGEIRMESVPGKGSTFSFMAEFGLQPGKKKEFKLPSTVLKGLRVLIVDDNTTCQEVLVNYLESFSFTAKAVNSGEKAIRELRHAEEEKKPYGLVLIDYKIPGTDGTQTARSIKQDSRIKSPPMIIMVTSFGKEKVMRMAEEIDLDGFLMKPVSQSLLFDAIIAVFSGEVRKHYRKEDKVIRRLPETFYKIQGAKILLVEDNEINQQVARELLENAGFWVTIAGNGKKAIAVVQSDHFDVVLMDLHMPSMDGYAAAREMRKKEKFKDLPIIAMTADVISGVKGKTRDAGMNDYITKPVNPEDLFTTLMKWIKPGDRERFVPGREAEDSFQDSKLKRFNALRGINVKDGLRRVNGNETLYRKLLQGFVQSNATFIQELGNALNKGDMELAIRMAHTLKGVSGNIGAGSISRTAKDLEGVLKDGDEKRYLQYIKKLEKELKKILAEISRLDVKDETAPGASPKGQRIDVIALAPQLNKLAVELAESDIAAVSTLEEIMENSLAPGILKAFDELEKYISKYEFDEALNRLNQLTGQWKIKL